MKKLLALPVALAVLWPATALAATPSLRQEATAVMTMVKQDIALIQRDEQIRSQSTSMAAITNDTTQMESQLQSVVMPPSVKVDSSILLRTAYKLGYDAASLQPVVGTTDVTLLHTLNNQVTADESVLSGNYVQVISDLNPLTIAPPPIVKAHHVVVVKKPDLTWHNWRNAAFVQHAVRPVIAAGWHILAILTGISVIVMVRRLFRRSHGLTP